MTKDTQVVALVAAPCWAGWPAALHARVELLLWLDIVSGRGADQPMVVVSARPELAAAAAHLAHDVRVVWCEDSRLDDEAHRIARGSDVTRVHVLTEDEGRRIAGPLSAPLLVPGTADAYTTVTIGEPAPLGWQAITAAGLSVVVALSCLDARLRDLHRGQRMHAVVDGLEVRACWLT